MPPTEEPGSSSWQSEFPGAEPEARIPVHTIQGTDKSSQETQATLGGGGGMQQVGQKPDCEVAQWLGSW